MWLHYQSPGPTPPYIEEVGHVHARVGDPGLTTVE
jgi:hypothetical protein